MDMKFILFVVVAVGMLDIATCLTPFQLRFRISKALCAPVSGHEKDIVPCYQFHTNKTVQAKDCGKKPNTHCCMYNCTCIMKGAGTKRGIIPNEYKLPPSLLKFNSSGNFTNRLTNCVPELTTNTTSQPKPTVGIQNLPNSKPGLTKTKPQAVTQKPVKTTRPKRISVKPTRSKAPTNKPWSAEKRPVTKKTGLKNRIPAPRTPINKRTKTKGPRTKRIQKSTPKPTGRTTTKGSRTNRIQISTRKSTARTTTKEPRTKRIQKSTRKPTPRKTTTKKTPPTKKPCRPSSQSGGFSILSRLSFLVQGFGFNSNVEAKNCR
ncbi:uncharacterized protein LOC120340422 [Styela clava]